MVVAPENINVLVAAAVKMDRDKKFSYTEFVY